MTNPELHTTLTLDELVEELRRCDSRVCNEAASRLMFLDVELKQTELLLDQTRRRLHLNEIDVEQLSDAVP